MHSTAGCGAPEPSRGRTMSKASFPPTVGAYSRSGSKITLSGMAGRLGCWAERLAVNTNRSAAVRLRGSIESKYSSRDSGQPSNQRAIDSVDLECHVFGELVKIGQHLLLRFGG